MIFKLLRELLNNNSSETLISFQPIYKYVNETINEELSKNAMPNFSHILEAFKNELEFFYNNIAFYNMTNKKVVSLGGAFSSGKSSFINYIINKSLLPYDINPSTSVPTYLMKDEKTKAYGINIFDNMFNLTLEDLKIICLGVEETEEHNLKISQLIKNIIIKIPYFPYNNLVFLDTPGYSKKGIEDIYYTDIKNMVYHYNSCDYCIWFISAPIGTVTEDEIDILKQIYKPKIFIVNKADILTDEDLDLVIKKLKADLKTNNIDYEYVFTFSKRKPNYYDAVKIDEFFRFLSDNNKKPNLKCFSSFFDKIEDYYNKNLLKENNRLFRVNNALTFVKDEKVYYNLDILATEIKENIRQINNQKDKLRKHKKVFFNELKILVNKYNLNISDFEVEQININLDNFSKAISQFKNEFGLKNEYELTQTLKNYLDTIETKKFADIERSNYLELESTVKSYVNNLNIYKDTISFLDINANTILKDYIINL